MFLYCLNFSSGVAISSMALSSTWSDPKSAGVVTYQDSWHSFPLCSPHFIDSPPTFSCLGSCCRFHGPCKHYVSWREASKPEIWTGLWFCDLTSPWTFNYLFTPSGEGHAGGSSQRTLLRTVRLEWKGNRIAIFFLSEENTGGADGGFYSSWSQVEDDIPPEGSRK